MIKMLKIQVVLATVAVTALLCGCMLPSHSTGRKWLRNAQGIAIARSPYTASTAILHIMPTDSWTNVVLQRSQCTIEVPSALTDPASPESLFDSPDWVSIVMYVFDYGYYDLGHCAQIEIRKKTTARYREDVNSTKNIMTEDPAWPGSAEGRDDIKWSDLEVHQELSARGPVYRRDVFCPDGKNMLWVRGYLETHYSAGQSLRPEMDKVIRRIIQSIRPIEDVQQSPPGDSLKAAPEE